jgi:hypothetical protein
VFFQHGGRVHICPELLVFAKRHVKLHGIGMVSLARKHGHGVVENVRATLNTLIQPTGAIFVLVDGDTVGLTTAVVYSVHERNVEFVGLFGEVVGTAHTCRQQRQFLIQSREVEGRTYLLLRHPQPTPSFSFVLPYLQLCRNASERVGFLVSKVVPRRTCEADSKQSK